MCFILLHSCALFSRDTFEVNLDRFPGLTAPAAQSAHMINDLFQSALIILNPNYLHSPISLVFKCAPSPTFWSNVFWSLQPKHWLNHLFRTHHLQGLVAMLTSFSNAPGGPASAASIPAVRPTEVGRAVLPPLLSGFSVSTHQFIHLISAPTLSSRQHLRHVTIP